MKHLAAYLLLTLGGNAAPSAADVKAVLESVGIEADSERLDKLISELEGKDINEVWRTGFSTSNLETNADMVYYSSSLLALRSSLPSPPAVLVPPLLVALLPLPAVPLRRPRLRRRRRVRALPDSFCARNILTHFTEKEESDEDMGFGLFD